MSNDPLELLVIKNDKAPRPVYTLGFLSQTSVHDRKTAQYMIENIIATGAVTSIKVQPDGNIDVIKSVPVDPQRFEMRLEIESVQAQPLPPIVIKGGKDGGGQLPIPSPEPVSGDEFETKLKFEVDDPSVIPVEPPQPPYTREYLIHSNFEIFSACKIFPDRKTDVFVEIPLADGFAISFQ
jgi:hypothetical protein